MYISVPVIVYSITEQNHPAKTLLNNPALYKGNSINTAQEYQSIFIFDMSLSFPVLLILFSKYT